MKAVVLVGGLGTRLRPLTLSTPKQMLPVVDRPMIEWVMGHLHAHGVDEAVLALGYKPDAFVDRYDDALCAGVSLVYAVEPEPLDTAGAVGFAAREAGISERFLVINGDVMTDLDISQLVDVHDAAEAEATIHLTPVDDPSRYGVVPIDDDGRVIEFVEKPPRDEAPTNWINAGTYVMEPSVLDRIEPDRRVSLERETFPALAQDQSLFAWQSDVYWIDTGTPATYAQAQFDLVEGRRSEKPPAVALSASVDADAVVKDSVVMAGAQVAAGADVSNSLLLDGSIVEENAVVADSIVGPRARVCSGASVDQSSVIGDDAVIESGASLSGARVPDSEG
jgi:mannose-1-phosphate guanylyltransferase